MKKYLLFVIALFSLFVFNTKAAQVSSSDFYFKFLDYEDVGFTFGVSSSLSQNGTVQIWNLDNVKYTYFVLDFCTTGWDNFSITNTGYNNYFNENFLVYRTGQTCSTGNYTGVLYRLQLSVGKYIDSNGDGFYATSYIHFTGSGNYHEYRFMSSVLSDTDILSPLISSSSINEKQQETNSKLDDVKSKQDQTNSKIDDVKGKQDQTNNKLDDLNSKQNQTNSKLDNIKDMDAPDSAKTKPDDSDYKDYESAQSDLTDKISDIDTDNVNIAIDPPSSNFIFDTMNKLIKSHPAVFTMFITILSIGIIKLGLGR